MKNRIFVPNLYYKSSILAHTVTGGTHNNDLLWNHCVYTSHLHVPKLCSISCNTPLACVMGAEAEHI